MRRFLTLVVVLPLALIVIVLSVANRQSVTFSLDPIGAGATGFAVNAPFYVFLFGALAVGVILGGVGAWIRQGRWRHAARMERANADRLRRDIARLHERVDALQSASGTLPAVRERDAA
jgi:hypothetical protein